MGWPHSSRRLVSLLLIASGLAVCGWQVDEHLRFKRDAAQALVNRGRDITSTLGVLVRAQRRYGIVAKDRLQSALQDLVRPGELESIAILGATGETIANAGTQLELTPEMLQARGAFWREHTLTILNLMDLGTNGGDENPRLRAPIVVTDPRTARSLRPAPQRRPADPEVADGDPPPPGDRPPYSRPTWMAKDEFDALIQKQGVHSIVIALSTDEMTRAVQANLLLRSLVSLLALGGAVVSTLAWRNVARNAELQIRLVKAGEMNTHLKELNLAAAGLAHETRNPLNLIRGHAQMASLQAGATPQLREHTTAIIEETDRVTGQLNEFINYSKPREPQLGTVDVARLVADLARTLLPDLEEKRIELAPPETTLLVHADEAMLRQALFNVLLNATQSVAGGGRIAVHLSASGPREAVLEISDDGPGVPAEHRANIFKPYVTMRPKGVGLGLAIVAQIASAHGWEVACLPREPRGAIFRFSHLKLAAPAT